MLHNAFRASRLAPLFVAIAATLAVACGPAEEAVETAEAPVCPTPADSILGGAIEKFITTREAVPHRFLVPLGTPEAVPDGAQYVLYAQGRQQYLWPADSASQKQQISNMRARGSHITMVLFYHGMTEGSDGKRTITLSGDYVDLANSGKKVPRTEILFDCMAPAGSRFTVAGMEQAPGGGL